MAYFGNTVDFATPGTVEVDEVERVLMRAASYIRKDGHAKRALYNDGAYCVRGALNRACGADREDPMWDTVPWNNRPVHSEAMGRLRKTIRTENEVVWNNAPERTAEEVIDALESAARARALVAEGK